jgi:hypothetical protein
MGLIATTYRIKITLVYNLDVINTPKPTYEANALSPPPSPHRAPTPAVLAIARCAPRPRCYAPCLIPRRRRGATRVLPRCANAAVPYQKVVAAVDVVAVAVRDLSKEMLR